MKLGEVLTWTKESENVKVLMDGKVVAEYNGKDSIPEELNDTTVMGATYGKLEGWIITVRR